MCDPSTPEREISEIIANGGPGWFACHQPTRPVDSWVRWHYGWCRPCAERASALSEAFPNDRHVQWLARLFNKEARRG
jgi:hypothetical protein